MIFPGQKDEVCIAKAEDGQCISAEGDNVFYEANPGGCISYHYELPDFHLPYGLHWYHPHVHGATNIHTATIHGILLIDEPEGKAFEKLLPANKRWWKDEKLVEREMAKKDAREACANLRSLIADKSREKLMILEGHFWRNEGQETGNICYGDDTIPFLELTVQQESNRGTQTDPLLQFDDINADCPQPANFIYPGQDFATINGAYIPDIELPLGKYVFFRL
eukprot:scaffold374516_cov48-Prasinocladus_malaysianus.AAC.1